jgi:hypothetical protein
VAAQQVSSAEVSACAIGRGLKGPDIGRALHQARVAAVAAALSF